MKRCGHPYYERHHHWIGRGDSGYLLEWCPVCGAKRVTPVRAMRRSGFGQGPWLLPGSKSALVVLPWVLKNSPQRRRARRRLNLR